MPLLTVLSHGWQGTCRCYRSRSGNIILLFIFCGQTQAQELCTSVALHLVLQMCRKREPISATQRWSGTVLLNYHPQETMERTLMHKPCQRCGESWHRFQHVMILLQVNLLFRFFLSAHWHLLIFLCSSLLSLAHLGMGGNILFFSSIY